MLPNFQFIDDLAKQLIQPKPYHYHINEIWKHIKNKHKYQYQNVQLKINNDQRITNLHMIKPKDINKKQQKHKRSSHINNNYQDNNSISNRKFIDRNNDNVFHNKNNNQENNHTLNNIDQIKMTNSIIIPQKQQKTCIIYLHGLSSYSLQGCFLVDNLQYFEHLNTSVCLYDMRGHGKDRATSISFSIKQSQQLYDIILHLKQRHKYSQFILWGRSMGSTTILNMLIKYEQQLLHNHINILHIILDSAFYSFEKVAIQLLSKQIHLPNILCKGILDYLLKKLQQKQHIKISIQIKQIVNKTPVSFLYSENDQIISAEHTKYLYKIYQYHEKDIIEINGIGHNQKRPDNIVRNIITKLAKIIQQQTQINKNKNNKNLKLNIHKFQQSNKQTPRKRQNQQTPRKRSNSYRKNGLKIITTSQSVCLLNQKQNYFDQYQVLNIRQNQQKQLKKQKLKVYSSQIIQRQQSVMEQYNLIKMNNFKNNIQIKGVYKYVKHPRASYKQHQQKHEKYLYQQKQLKYQSNIVPQKNSKKLGLSHKFIKDQRKQLQQCQKQNNLNNKNNKQNQQINSNLIQIGGSSVYRSVIVSKKQVNFYDDQINKQKNN